MTFQHQPDRRFASIATTDMPLHDSKSYQNPTGSYAHGKPESYATDTAGDDFQDSGCFTQQSSVSASPFRPYDDFVLYDPDREFFDDEASLRANNGSIYNGTRDSSTAYIPKYTSYDTSRSNEGGCNSTPMSKGSRASSQSYVYQPTQPDRPSLFGEYELVPTQGPSPLSQWVVSPSRHEEIGVRCGTLPRSQDDEESIRLTPEPTSPPPSSKPRKSRSGSSKSQRRKH